MYLATSYIVLKMHPSYSLFNRRSRTRIFYDVNVRHFMHVKLIDRNKDRRNVINYKIFALDSKRDSGGRLGIRDTRRYYYCVFFLNYFS